MERAESREREVPWVFWHEYRNKSTGRMAKGSFTRRKRMMPSICKKAGVQPFGFHALRHFGASMMAKEGLPIKSISRLLGHEAARKKSHPSPTSEAAEHEQKCA